MPITRVNYYGRIVAALAELALSGYVQFSIPLLLELLKGQKLPPPGKHVLRRTRDIMGNEVIKGHISVVDEIAQVYRMTALGINTYRTILSSRTRPSSPNLKRTSGCCKVLGSSSRMRDDCYVRKHGISPRSLRSMNQAVSKLSSLMSRLSVSNIAEIGTSGISSAEGDSSKCAALVKNLCNTFDQVALLGGLLKYIDIQLASGPDSSTEPAGLARYVSFHPLVHKFADFVRCVKIEQQQLQNLRTAVAACATERSNLNNKLVALRHFLDNNRAASHVFA